MITELAQTSERPWRPELEQSGSQDCLLAKSSTGFKMRTGSIPTSRNAKSSFSSLARVSEFVENRSLKKSRVMLAERLKKSVYEGTAQQSLKIANLEVPRTR